MRTRPHPVVLDLVVELPLIVAGLFDLRERAERDGDRVVELLASDDAEAVLALLDGVEHQRAAAPPGQ